jgi:dihydrofolate synthase / folylpolyglutamate synthase
MNFQESIEYLYGLGNEVLAMKLGLGNITTLLAALGNPQKNYLKVQIAGTNGKGSTVAFLESICVNAGINVGSTTSPHLISITERVKINGREISEEDFAKYATKIRETSEQLVENFRFQISDSKLENKESGIRNLKSEIYLETVPTFFEQVTAIALLAFSEANVELAILETGLGGRFDATTAAKAEIVAITPIDLDHQKILGETLAEIAAEKAAIIREDTKVVVSEQKAEALNVILEKCKEKNVAPVFNQCRFIEENQDEYFFLTKTKKYFVTKLGLAGEHQRQNACTAINLTEILISDFKFQIPDLVIEKGLENAKHKGRLEWKEINDVKILFDGAHNVAGAKALRKYLETIGYKFTLVFGAMKDKDLSEITEILFPLAQDIILTKPDNPRSMEVKELQKYAEKFVDKSKLFLIPNVADAINSAIQINANYTETETSFVCITGSLYLVGEAQKFLKNEFGI